MYDTGEDGGTVTQNHRDRSSSRSSSSDGGSSGGVDNPGKANGGGMVKGVAKVDADSLRAVDVAEEEHSTTITGVVEGMVRMPTGEAFCLGIPPRQGY